MPRLSSCGQRFLKSVHLLAVACWVGGAGGAESFAARSVRRRNASRNERGEPRHRHVDRGHFRSGWLPSNGFCVQHFYTVGIFSARVDHVEMGSDNRRDTVRDFFSRCVGTGDARHERQVRFGGFSCRRVCGYPKSAPDPVMCSGRGPAPHGLVICVQAATPENSHAAERLHRRAE